MTTKNRAKSLIAAALIGKAFKNNNIPSTVIKDSEEGMSAFKSLLATN